MQIYTLLLFGVVLGKGTKRYSSPSILIEGCAGDPPHPRHRHLCSQELVLEPRSEREQDEDVQGEWEGTSFPPQLTTQRVRERFKLPQWNPRPKRL